MHGIMRMWSIKEFSEHRRYLRTSMAKASLVDKEYPKIGQRYLNVLFLRIADQVLHMISE